VELDKLLPPQAKNLKTMRGISTILSAKLVAHANGIERFKNLDKFIRYAGIAPLERSSGKTKKYIKANRGNRKLNSAIYMIALSQLCWNEEARKYVEKKVLEGKTKRHAIRCLMKRMACIVYGMMKSGEPYRGK
jgi:transposase